MEESLCVAIAIVGSRDFNNKAYMKEKLNSLGNKLDGVKCIVSGGAKGADSYGEQWAKINGYEKLIFNADWNKFGRSAGPIRNTYIVQNSDLIIAFPRSDPNNSRGTYDTIKNARKANIPLSAATKAKIL